MKACSYCGDECSDNAAVCPSCGTELIAPPIDPPGEPFRRPPRPEAVSVILRTFPLEVPAQHALAALRAARIEAFIATDDCGGFYPPLSTANPFRLVVSEVHHEAAEQVLAELEGRTAPADKTDATMAEIPVPPPAPPSTLRPLGLFALGIVAGVLVTLGYQRSQGSFSGTIQRDFNHDGRIDGWDTYRQGEFTRSAADENGDERPDVWYDFEDGKTTKWERDYNFDGKVDDWGTYDGRGVPSQSKTDLDFDGKPDVTNFYEFGLIKESHCILLSSGLVWKKSFFTNGLPRVERIDRDRDGTFDEQLSFDVYGVEIKKEKLN